MTVIWDSGEENASVGDNDQETRNLAQHQNEKGSDAQNYRLELHCRNYILKSASKQITFCHRWLAQRQLLTINTLRPQSGPIDVISVVLHIPVPVT